MAEAIAMPAGKRFLHIDQDSQSVCVLVRICHWALVNAAAVILHGTGPVVV